MTSPEIHLFVLWEKVGPSRETILHRIGAEFEILRVFRIQWSPSLFSDNLSRFYGQKLPPGCNKEESCGTGPFTLALVRDTRPDYAMRETTRGPAIVNTRIFDLKAFFRSPAGGSLPIHASDSAREAAHDLALLIGVAPSGFEAAYPGPWDGEVHPLRRDVSGAQGWESLGELFAVLNETVDYVVLRNFECLPGRYHLESHGDIDLLVASHVDACLIANATAVFDDPCRVHAKVVVGGQVVPFDFRHVGDGYYDERWQRSILESRLKGEGGFFVPDPENHFYSLIYHAAVHKSSVAPDYAERLSTLATSLDIPIPVDGFFADPRRLRAFLLDYMNPRNYRFTRPQDASVYFNEAVALSPAERIANRILPRKRHAPLVKVSMTRQGAQPVYDLEDERLTGAARANLLYPLEFAQGQRILELGCEAGVLTYHLGNLGAEVLAVESVPGLAALARERCRDLSNVRVICDDPLTAEADDRFDVVTLIGTAERIAAGPEAGDPLAAFLDRAAAALKPGGLLVIAVDNPLGLRFFNGCADERTGIPFFGINGLHDRGEPAPVGHKVLAEKIRRAGFGSAEFLLPFPDYRRPGIVLNARALGDARFEVADLLIHNMGRSHPETHHRAFAEDLAWRTVAENGLLVDLANSFLVLARLGDAGVRPADWLAKMYGRGRRHPFYQVESTIEPDESGSLVVRKRRIFPDAPCPAGGRFRHVIADSAYIPGDLLVRGIHRAMACEAGIEELAVAFTPWLEFLLAHASVDASGGTVLPENFVDCIPSNLIRLPSGELRYFDAEWVSDTPVSFAWIVVRGIAYSLIDCLENAAIGRISYREFISQIAERCGISLGDRDFATADLWETRLVEQCHADAYNTPRIADFLDTPLFLTIRLASRPQNYRDSLAWHQAELARVKKTVSWRITAPLRVSWNLFRRLLAEKGRR